MSRPERRQIDGTQRNRGFTRAGEGFYVWDEDARSGAAWAAELAASAPVRACSAETR